MDSPSTSYISSAASTPQSQLPKPKMVSRKPNATPFSKPRAQNPVSQKAKLCTVTAPQDRRMSENDDPEHLFWSGRKPSALSNADSLLSEELDMTGMDSLMSPSPIKKKPFIHTNSEFEEKLTAYNSAIPAIQSQGGQEDDNDYDSESESGEPTIVVSKLAHTSPVPEISSDSLIEPPRPSSQAPSTPPHTPGQLVNSKDDAIIPPSTSKGKVRRIRITAEIERVCVGFLFMLFDQVFE